MSPIDPSRPAPDTPRLSSRFSTLDAMRGVAAIAVVLYHLMPWTVRSGYLAVDFFFLLSGFVIAKTYAHRLAGDLSFAGFVRLRGIRLYPLLFIGLLLGVIRHLLGISVAPFPALSAAPLLGSAVINSFFLPSPFSTLISPVNGPAWSLIFEMLVNLLYAGLLIRRKYAYLVGVMLVSLLVLLVSARASGHLNIGNLWDQIHVGFARVGFSFVVGVFVARLDFDHRHRHGLAAALPIVLLALLVAGTAGPLHAGYDLVFVVVIGPALLYFGARYEPPARLEPAARRMGELSYPLYVIHSPILLTVEHYAPIWHVPRVAWIPVFLLGTVALAWLLEDCWDKPVRSLLTRRAG